MRVAVPLDPVACAAVAFALLSPAAACGGSSVDAGEPHGSGGSSGVPLGNCDGASAIGESGWITCGTSALSFAHRESLGTCDPFVPRPGEVMGCRDSDCSHLPYGHCWSASAGFGVTASCIAGCVADADCAPGESCFCEEPVGRCIPADCSIDADCGPTAFCSTYVGPPMDACSFYIAGATCQRQGDACSGDDCHCALVSGERACVQGLGGCSAR